MKTMTNDKEVYKNVIKGVIDAKNSSDLKVLPEGLIEILLEKGTIVEIK